jgi:hypothetical protein
MFMRIVTDFEASAIAGDGGPWRVARSLLTCRKFKLTQPPAFGAGLLISAPVPPRITLTIPLPAILTTCRSKKPCRFGPDQLAV